MTDWEFRYLSRYTFRTVTFIENGRGVRTIPIYGLYFFELPFEDRLSTVATSLTLEQVTYIEKLHELKPWL